MTNWQALDVGERVERVRAALKRTRGNVRRAAEKLGVSRQTLTVFLGMHGGEVGVRTNVSCPNCGHMVPLRKRAGASRAETAAIPA